MLWLDRYGTLELDDVLAPAVTVVREGYAVSPEMARWLDRRAALIDDRPDAAAIDERDGELVSEGDAGIHINNRMRVLSVDDDDPNRLTPGYEVRHTSNPCLAVRDDRAYVLGGNTGVDTRPQGQTQQFVHVAEFGLDAQEAISRPRFVGTAFPSTRYPYDVGDALQMESEFPPDLIRELEERGHDAEGESIQVGAEPRCSTASGRVVKLVD